MSRLCLVSLEAAAVPACALGPGLRALHFASALVRHGHEVAWVRARTGVASGAAREQRAQSSMLALEGARIDVLETADRAFGGPAVARWVRARRPDALVGVTVFGASLAVRLGLDLPFWADVFGDLMAEAQAKAVVHDDNAILAHFWSTLVPVLVRADRLSAVSGAQADALVGQLGLLGRLSTQTASESLVHVIPCAAEPPTPAAPQAHVLRGHRVADDAFVVLWSGSFNTWCDVDTLVAGLERAMDRAPHIVFVATGGAVAGHDERTYARFRAHVRSSRHRSRFHVLGWVDTASLEAITAEADVGVIVERNLYERRLGSENRAVWWMARGLASVTTACSELGRTLTAEGLAFPCAPGRPESLARVLCMLAGRPASLREAGALCRQAAARRYSYEATAAPLLAWARKPHRAGDACAVRALEVGLVNDRDALAPLLDRYLADLSLAQVAYRSVRWLARRLTRGVRTDRQRSTRQARVAVGGDRGGLSIAEVCD